MWDLLTDLKFSVYGVCGTCFLEWGLFALHEISDLEPYMSTSVVRSKNLPYLVDFGSPHHLSDPSRQ